MEVEFHQLGPRGKPCTKPGSKPYRCIALSDVGNSARRRSHSGETQRFKVAGSLTAFKRDLFPNGRREDFDANYAMEVDFSIDLAEGQLIIL